MRVLAYIFFFCHFCIAPKDLVGNPEARIQKDGSNRFGWIQEARLVETEGRRKTHFFPFWLHEICLLK